MPLFERIPTSEYLQPASLPYVDVAGLHGLYDKIAFKADLVLVGAKGSGKTLSVKAWAAKNQIPVVTCDCSEDARRSSLLGMSILRGSETPFILGPLPTAFEVANDAGACILDMEEMNALSPQMQKLLNPVCDWRKAVEVPEAGKVFRLAPGKRLWVVATMNTSVYGGVYSLNEDLKSRFRMLTVSYPPTKEEKRIITETVKTDLDPKLIDGVLLLAHETRQKSLEYALSTRDVVQIIEDAGACGIQMALRLTLGKFEGEDRATVKERIVSIFGFNADEDGTASEKAASTPKKKVAGSW